jgi:DNA-binding response OmpR family regulator
VTRARRGSGDCSGSEDTELSLEYGSDINRTIIQVCHEGKRMRILIAEDDDVSRLLLERLLEKAGHDIISTEDGLKGLGAYKENKIDMAILDWMMPEMDGIELCRSIRKIEEKAEIPTYIIMVTAKSEAEDMMHALSIGVDDFLTKPVDRDLLEKRIHAGLKYQNFLRMKTEVGRYSPLLALREEHNVLRSVVHIVDAIYDELESGVPEQVLKWSMSTLTDLTLRLHYGKEELYYQTFINAITTEHVDWFGQISESSFVTISEEHEELESRLMKIQGQISQYLLKQQPDAGPLRTSVKNYTDLLLRHMYREENIFFPFAQKYISHDEVVDLMDIFNGLNNEYGQAGIQRLVREINAFLDHLTKGGKAIDWRPPQ